MVILFQWLFVHFLGDFVFQTPKMVQHKKRLKAGSWVLYLHCLLHGALIIPFTPALNYWPIPVIVAATHYVIDLWKLHRPETVTNFIIDQLVHLLILFVLWCVYIAPSAWLLQLWEMIQGDTATWAVITGYLLITIPLSFLLTFATQRWRRQAEESNVRTANGLNEAGKWIGIFERILVYTFVITGHFEGIGFLIAAKSILRYNDIKSKESRKEAEYILIGTLMSFSISIIIGIIIKGVLNTQSFV